MDYRIRNIDKIMWRKFKAWCAMHDTTMRDMIFLLIKDHLNRQDKKEAK